VVLITTIVLSSCTQNFEELNTRPDAIISTNVNASLLGQAFAQAQFRGMKGDAGAFQLYQSLFGDIYAQYFANTQVNFDSDRHVQVGGWSNGAWVDFYASPAPQIKFVLDFSAENNLPLENALMKIWKVQVYHRITDYWGPIIYSEFGNQKETVAYDTQESVYRNFFTTLDEAVSVLKANATGLAFASHDQIYGGNIAKWLVFANSLRLRLAIRCKYVDANLSRTEAEKAVADGVMTGNEANAMLTPTINSRNPYWTITDWGEFRMSAAMESVLKGYSDPRMPQYFSPVIGVDLNADGTITQAEKDPDADGSLYEGLRNGHAKSDISATLNRVNSDMGLQFLNVGRGGSAAGAPIRVMSASEVFFLRAEGALENWAMGGTAIELYNKGIEASLKERTTATAGDIAAYTSSAAMPIATKDQWNTPALSTIPVAFDAGGGKERQLEQIITQKWIALYPDGVEAWTEVRRTGYPKLYPRLNSENSDVPADQIMRRLIFVDSEYSNNADAVAAAAALPELSAKGGNKNSTRLWWDAK
ncbi:MAG: SusD/RagB family nutrient-binding outer membrane lipoprotein, partial [Cyclobacteriaceae bacterium]